LKTGWLFYQADSKIEFVKSSNVVYLTRKLAESLMSNYHHGWMSQEAQAEAYNETWRDSVEVQLVKKFLEENSHVGAQFDKKVKPEEMEFVSDIVDEEDGNVESREDPAKRYTCRMFELHRKSVGQAYYSIWVPQELQERGMLKRYLFGPYYKGSFGILLSFQPRNEFSK
jgi:hypothetical protein